MTAHAPAADVPLAARGGGGRRTDLALTLLAVAIFCTMSIWLAITSTAFSEADGCSHYLYARFAFEQPSYFVNVWGRPVFTILYALPALVGRRLGVRLTSLVLALACAAVAQRIARLQGLRRPALALVLTLGQPLVFLHSFSELTELPFALMLGLALLAYQRQAFLAMTLLVGFMPASRPEGFAFVLLTAGALVLHRRWRLLTVLPLPLIAWDVCGWLLYGREGNWWSWLVRTWPYAAESIYKSGSLFHFVMLMPAITSPLIFPATCLGIWLSLRPWRRFLADHAARCVVLTAALPLAILAGHSLLYWTGKMASSGELRYMVTAAPLWGVLGARGWEWVFERWPRRNPVLWAGVAVLLACVVNNFWRAVPVTLDTDWVRARQIADWYETWPDRALYPRIEASHPGIYYFLDRSMVGPGSREWSRKTTQTPAPGTLLVWDNIYGFYNSDATRSVDLKLIQHSGWLPGIGLTDDPAALAATAPDEHWRVFRSPEPATQPAIVK